MGDSEWNAGAQDISLKKNQKEKKLWKSKGNVISPDWYVTNMVALRAHGKGGSRQ